MPALSKYASKSLLPVTILVFGGNKLMDVVTVPATQLVVINTLFFKAWMLGLRFLVALVTDRGLCLLFL